MLCPGPASHALALKGFWQKPCFRRDMKTESISSFGRYHTPYIDKCPLGRKKFNTLIENSAFFGLEYMLQSH
jgi:hypothetical protein